MANNPNVSTRIATQFLIYEIVTGLRDADTFNRRGSNGYTSGDVFYNAGVASVSGFAEKYNSIVSSVQNAMKIPSFTSRSSGSAPTITMSGSQVSVTDSNGVLGNFSFTNGNAFIDAQYGMIPTAQKAAGDAVISWYTTTKPWPFILVLANLWKNVGYSTVLYLAAITGIDSTQYEAAAIDGATKWDQVRYVTLPHLRTMICILFIMNVGKIFAADFGLFYNVPMQNGALFSVTQVIDTYIYRVLVTTGDISFSSAAGLLQNVIGFVCIMTANSIIKKLDPDSSLF